jgi:4-amino-4-deoxy-L-arabinose transferase-like glycosyltransferase
VSDPLTRLLPREGAWPSVSVLYRWRTLAIAAAGALITTRFVLLWRFPPFLDESLYASWTLQVHQSFGARWVALVNGKLPLLSWLGAGLMGVGIEPLTAVRLVSIAAGVASAVFAALIAAEIGGRRAAIAAAAVYAILPLALVHDVLGLMEPLLAGLLVASLYLQLRLARRPSLVTGALLGLVFAAALLTKETGYLPLVLLPFSLVVFDWGAPERVRRLGLWAGAAGLACVLGAFAELVLASSGELSAYRAAQKNFGTFRSLHSGLAHPLRWAEQVWPGYRPELLGYLTWPLALAALAGAAVSLWRRSRPAMLCLLWILACFTVDLLFLSNAFVRYLVPAAPFFAVLAAVGLGEIVSLARRVVPSVPLAALGAAAVIAAMAALPIRFDLTVLSDPNTAAYPGVSVQEYETGWSAGTGVGALASTLRRLGRAHPAVVTWYGHRPIALMLELRHDRAVVFDDSVGPTADAAAHSDFVVTNDLPLPPGGFGLGTLRHVQTFPRPRDGVALGLYRRGVAWRGRFYTSADGLRRGLGLDDRHFDAFIVRHPRMRAWYIASAS